MPSPKKFNEQQPYNHEEQLAPFIMNSAVWKRQDVADFLGCGLGYVNYLIEHEGLPCFHPGDDDERRLTLFSEFKVKYWFFQKQKSQK